MAPGCTVPGPCVKRVRARTSAWDPTSKAPQFLNGANSLVAESYSVQGLRTTTGSNIVLSNVDGFVASITQLPAKSVTAGNAVWYGGTVTGSFSPILYSGKSLASLSVRFGIGTPVTATPSGSKTFTATFNYPGYTSANKTPETLGIVSAPYTSGGSVTSGFVPGGAPTTSLRLDNAGPTGTLSLPTSRWVNAAYVYSSGLTSIVDVGVGVPATPTAAFEWSGCGSSNWTAFSGAASSLGECASDLTNGAYSLRATATDLLGNSGQIVSSASFGVDVTPPTIAFAPSALADSAIVTGAIPTILYDVQVTDTRSGPDLSHTDRYLALTNRSTQLCSPGTGVPGAQFLSNPTCGFAQGFGAVGMPASQTAGFLRYRARGLDLAGNTSAELTRVAVVDGANPFVSALSLTPFTANVPPTFVASVSDNLELREAAAFIRYPAVNSLTGLEFWIGFPAPPDTTIAGNQNAAVRLPFSDPFDDILMTPPNGLRPWGDWLYWFEPSDASGAVQAPAVYGGNGNMDAMQGAASDHSGRTQAVGPITNPTAVSGTVPTTSTSWWDWNIANPSNRVIQFSATYKSQTGPNNTQLQGTVVVPVTANSAAFRKISYFVRSIGPSGRVVWCYVGESTSFTEVPIDATTKKFTTATNGGGGLIQERRSCVGAVPNIRVLAGNNLTVVPVLVRNSNERETLVGQPFVIP